MERAQLLASAAKIHALAGCAPGTPVAIESTANWYWIANEIEQAGPQPRLGHLALHRCAAAGEEGFLVAALARNDGAGQ